MLFVKEAEVEKLQREEEKAENVENFFEANQGASIDEMLEGLQRAAGEAGDSATVVSLEQAKATRAEKKAEDSWRNYQESMKWLQYGDAETARQFFPPEYGDMPQSAPTKMEIKSVGGDLIATNPYTQQFQVLMKGQKSSGSGKSKSGVLLVGPSGDRVYVPNTYEETAPYYNQGYTKYAAPSAQMELAERLGIVPPSGSSSGANKSVASPTPAPTKAPRMSFEEFKRRKKEGTL